MTGWTSWRAKGKVTGALQARPSWDQGTRPSLAQGSTSGWACSPGNSGHQRPPFISAFGMRAAGAAGWARPQLGCQPPASGTAPYGHQAARGSRTHCHGPHTGSSATHQSAPASRLLSRVGGGGSWSAASPNPFLFSGQSCTLRLQSHRERALRDTLTSTHPTSLFQELSKCLGGHAAQPGYM